MALRRTKYPIVLEVAAFPLNMRPDWHNADEEWLEFFRQQTAPLRCISMHVPFDLRAPLERVQRLCRPLNRWAHEFAPIPRAVDEWTRTGDRPDMAQLVEALPVDLRDTVDQALAAPPDVASLEDWQDVLDVLREPLWRRPALLDYAQWYEELMAKAPLRGLRHFVIAWVDDYTQAAVDELASLVQYAFQTEAWEVDLPSVFPGRYLEEGKYLYPEENHHPLSAILTAYDVKGAWASGDLFHKLLALGVDMSIVIDVATIDRAKANFRATYYANVDKARRMRGDDDDVKANKRGDAAREAQEALDQGQTFHEVNIHLAVFAPDEDELKQAVQRVLLGAGIKLPLVHAAGVQASLAKFWTTTETGAIDQGPARRTRQVLSHGVASLIPFGHRMPSRTDGVLWLAHGNTPIFFDPFADQRPGHMVMVGLTGSGKTYSLNVWLRRLLAMGCRVVVMEPQGHSARLVKGVGHGGQHFPITLEDALNPLDIVVYRKPDGTPPRTIDQVEHVMAQISVLMGTDDYVSVGGNTKKTFRPKMWTDNQRAILRLALSQLYAPFNLEDLTADRTPILSDLIRHIEELAANLAEGINGMPKDARQAEVASELASTFRITFLLGDFGQTINRRTTIDWSLNRPLTAYGLNGLPEGLWRTYYFGQIFGAVNRWVRSPIRDRTYPTIVVFDEFAFSLRRIPTLAEFASEATKTWRTFNAHFWAADQDLHWYLGTGEHDQNPDLFSVWLNSQIKMIMLQEPLPAQRLKGVLAGVHDGHVKAITRFRKGHGLLVWKPGDSDINEMFEGYVISTTEEQRLFMGT